jgi:hypothetical protein
MVGAFQRDWHYVGRTSNGDERLDLPAARSPSGTSEKCTT